MCSSCIEGMLSDGVTLQSAHHVLRAVPALGSLAHSAAELVQRPQDNGSTVWQSACCLLVCIAIQEVEAGSLRRECRGPLKCKPQVVPPWSLPRRASPLFAGKTLEPLLAHGSRNKKLFHTRTCKSQAAKRIRKPVNPMNPPSQAKDLK